MRLVFSHQGVKYCFLLVKEKANFSKSGVVWRLMKYQTKSTYLPSFVICLITRVFGESFLFIHKQDAEDYIHRLMEDVRATS